MSILSKVLGTIVKLVPDKSPDPLLHKHGWIGKPVSRVDGLLKVTGRATFSAEYHFENMAYATLVHSTIASGKITSVDLRAAKAAPGVVDIITHENAPRLRKPPMFSSTGTGGAAASGLPVMQSADIYWNGQPVAVVIAETQEQADHAALLIVIDYKANDAATSFEKLKSTATVPDKIMRDPAELKKGDADKALHGAAAKVDNVYTTPRYNHNAIELHATIAVWDGDNELVVYDPSQSLTNVKNTLVETFNLKEENVRILAPYVGGGFGGKGMLWNHTILCAAAAKVVGRPVKLVLSREGTFRSVGGRTLSEQRVALGADNTGRLVSLIHTGTTAVVSHNNFPEQFSFPARHLYAMENFFIQQKTLELDMVANTAMRAPGESIGTFALESAIDELAEALKIDPVELRRINEPEKDPTTGTEFSSRNIVEAYRRGAEKFGWANRNMTPGAQRDGDWLVGQGVATAYYPYFRMKAAVCLQLNADGTAIVQSASHEMGMGTATVQIQHASDRLGLPPHCVAFEYGDSNLPESPTAGGSMQTASIAAALIAAADKLKEQLLKMVAKDSPLADAKAEDVVMRDSGLYRSNGDGQSYADILHHAGETSISVEASSAQPVEILKYSMQSFGAQFCEVRVHSVTGETRVSRWLGSFDCGTILNPKTASSQFRGGIIMGIGMALTEESLFDDRYGRFMNPSLAEYHVPVHLDVPEIEIIYNDIADVHTPLGAHGVGEIGITGVAAAIANAVYNATGKRVRSLPITLDKLM